MRTVLTRVALTLSIGAIAAACSTVADDYTPGDGTGPDGLPAGNPNGKDTGGECGVGNDCKSGVCTDTKCAAPTATDGIRNGDETGLDCGGKNAPRCPLGKGCLVPTDCTTGACVDGLCAAGTANDGVKNGDETDLDCGGSVAPACVDGKGCAAGKDCASQVCGADKKCAVPTGTDGFKNGDETDLDCGGTATGAPKCAVGKACAAHADCTSDACSYKKVCLEYKSCVPHSGGDTCGPTTNDANHENCCTRIAGSPLDKYNVTAGRFRQFVERTNGNLRAWAMGQNAPGWDHAWDTFLPTMLDNGGTTPDDSTPFTGVYQELGPYVHVPGATGANEGCDIKGNGARTFRLPDAVNTRIGDKQFYTQEIYDAKPLNCVPAYMMAAFCFWDGGRLPTRVEFNAAWGAATYPWGAAPAAAGWITAYDSDATGTPFTPAGGDVKRANYNYNYWSPATKLGTDYAVFIAEPGRFPTGAGPQGHQDLAGLFQYESITPAKPPATGYQVDWSKSGSWQGHQIPYGALSTNATNKYWATGGRCAR